MHHMHLKQPGALESLAVRQRTLMQPNEEMRGTRTVQTALRRLEESGCGAQSALLGSLDPQLQL